MYSEKRYKFVAPDGGWGYLVGLGIIISNVASIGFTPHIGLLYKELIEELKMGTQFITTVTAVCAICISLAGYLSSPLMKVLLSQRQLMFIGAVLLNVGGFGVIFARTHIIFMLTQCVQAVGIGFLINMSYIAINDYFMEKKVLFMSLTQAAPCVANMLAPLIITWLNEKLGYKGTLLIISGVYLQVFVSAILMQPVEWHMKKVEIIDEANEKPLLITSSKEISRSLKSEDSHKITIGIEKLKNSATSTSCVDAEDGKGSEDVVDSSKEGTCLQKLVSALNLSVFKDFTIVNTCLGLGFCLFSNANFITVLPFALRNQGWQESVVASAISFYGFGDISFRVVIIVFSKFFARIGVRPLYMFGLVIGIISRLAMLWSDSVTMITVFIAIAGLANCTVTSLPPLIMSEVVVPEQFAAAAGVLMLLSGVIFMVFGPAVGAVRDLTNSYETTFYMLTSFLAIVLMFWLIEACYRNNQKKIQKLAKTSRVR